MKDDNPTDSELETLEDLIDFSGNEERSHASGERAAEQTIKLLGTVHAGLGLTLAAWLQRVFEHAGDSPLSTLTWYLTISLILVMLGLISLAVTPILDQFQAMYYATHIARNKARFVVHRQHLQLQESKNVARDSDIKRSKHLRSEDRRLKNEGESAGDKADSINSFSRVLAVASCVFLILSLGSLASGVIATVRHLEKPPAIVAPAVKSQADQVIKKP